MRGSKFGSVSSKWLGIASSAALALAAGACLEDENPASDVRGNYAVVYDDEIRVTLYIGGAVYEATASGETGTLTFATAEAGDLVIDLGLFCDLPEVQCPSETFWTEVAIDQPFMRPPNPNSHIVNVVDNRNRNLPPGEEAPAVGGLIDDQDQFILALGAGLTGNGTNCALLALSWATGTFTTDAMGAIDGVTDGNLGVGFLGGCVWPGLAVGASLVLETGYTASRTGAFDPPPYVAVDPEEVEPGLPPEGM